MKDSGCWPSCQGWDDDDRGLGCYGWCKTKNIPITSQEVYREECKERVDKTKR